MKTIQLTKGQVAMVDDQDHEWLSRFKWCASKRRDGGYYAVRSDTRAIGHPMLMMHRVILCASESELIDHKNNNGLDNQRHNLRSATRASNLWNRGPQKNNRSGYKGVVKHSKNPSWSAEIMVNKRRLRKHGFPTPEAAALAYNEMAREFHGEFAVLNIIPEQLAAERPEIFERLRVVR